jgi:hypothetical protein
MPVDNIDECGIFGIGRCKRFRTACKWHDDMYVMKEEKGNPLSREEVDKKFYNAMLAAAGDSLYYQLKAKVYYGIVRAVGWYFWRY